MLRYLQAVKWDYEKAYKAIMQHFTWTQNEKPHVWPGDHTGKLLNSGYIYLLKRDRKYRPLLLMNVSIVKTFLEAEADLLLGAVNYFLTYTIDKCCFPGKAETMILIIDMKDVGMTQIPVGVIKKFLGSA